MPRRSRQRSTAPTSGRRPRGPRRPGPVGSTQRVALPDVAGDRDGVRRRPAARPSGAPASRARRARRGRPGPAGAAGRNRHSTQPAASSRTVSSTAPRVPAGQPVGAVRQGGGPLGDRHQPARRPAGQPDQGVGRAAARAAPTTAAARPSTVAGGTAGAASRLAGSETRLTVPESPATSGAVDQAGGRADRERVGERAASSRGRAAGRDQPGASSTMPPVAATERAKPGSRGQPRVERGAARTPRRRGPGRAARGRPGGQGQQRHRTHGGGADDARARPGQDDEADEREPGDDRLHAAVDGPPAERPQHAGQHDRDVGAGHGGQVRQPGPAEVLLEDRVHGARCRRRRDPGAGPPAAARAPGRRIEPSPSRRPPAARCSAPGRADQRTADRARRARRPRRPRGRAARRRPARGRAAPGAGPASPRPARRGARRRRSRWATPPSTSPVTVASATIRGGPAPGQHVRVAVELEDDGDGPLRLGDRA